MKAFDGSISKMVAVGIVAIVTTIASLVGILDTYKPQNSAMVAAIATSRSEAANREAVLAIIPVFVNEVQNRDIQALSNYYTNTSVVLWSGTAAGLQGIDSGQNSIRLLYVSSLSHMDRLSASAIDVNAKSEGSNVTVSMTIKFFTTNPGTATVFPQWG